MKDRPSGEKARSKPGWVLTPGKAPPLHYLIIPMCTLEDLPCIREDLAFLQLLAIEDLLCTGLHNDSIVQASARK